MLFGILLACIILALVATFRSEKNNSNSPPGPKGLPIVGHLLYFGNNPALQFLKWKRTYGPIFSIALGSFPAVVINDVTLIKEALSHPAICGRPKFPNFIEMCRRTGLVLIDGERQSEQRKFAKDSFKEFGVGRSKLEYNILEEIQKFQDNLKLQLNNQGGSQRFAIKHFFQLPVINSLWVVIMGKRFLEGDMLLNELTELLESSMVTNQTIMAQASYFIPLCAKFLNFFGINHVVNCYRKYENHMEKLIEQQRVDHVPGKPKHFTHAYFDKTAETKDSQSSFHASRREQVMSTLEMFSAAIDTTTNTLDWLLLYMAREPEVQTKLQTEIDSVISTTSSNPEAPSLMYRNKMPYTEAVTLELLRISSVAPFGLYRRVLDDIVFHGYSIPKDTTIISNQFGAHHDSQVWENPDEFKPERFLKDDGSLNKMSREIVPFGYGRRACIGEEFAWDELFLFTANFFQQFRVECSDKIPSTDGEFSLVYVPKPFEVVISQRCVLDSN